MAEPRPPLKTASMNLPLLWLSIHSALRQDAGQANRAGDEDDLQAESILALLEELEAYPLDKWFTFCDLCGPTLETAIAGSWCQAAPLAAVLKHIDDNDLLNLETAQDHKRIIECFKSDLLPSADMISIAAVSTCTTDAAVLILAHKETVTNNLPPEQTVVLNRQVFALL